ncbi:MAG: undecaprenyl-diphosphate phosphatase, partial [Candidatus Bathyarchaeia archaeon]
APGVSRSGATISAGLFLGLNKEAATRFSFLISIPIILGANINEIIHYFRLTQGKGTEPINLLVIGFVSSLTSGYLAIKYFLKYLKKGELKIFSLYCALIATIALIARYFHIILF